MDSKLTRKNSTWHQITDIRYYILSLHTKQLNQITILYHFSIEVTRNEPCDAQINNIKITYFPGHRTNTMNTHNTTNNASGRKKN